MDTNKRLENKERNALMRYDLRLTVDFKTLTNTVKVLALMGFRENQVRNLLAGKVASITHSIPTMGSITLESVSFSATAEKAGAALPFDDKSQ